MRAALTVLLLIAGSCAWAQVPVPPLTARVTDTTGTLSAEQKTALEQTLEAFEKRKGSQLAVLLVPTTEPETIEQYGLRVAEQWKLGRKGVDDGALLLVAKNDRTLRIEVGYGLEGALNDAMSKRIISESIVPRFKQGDFYGGIAAGIDSMIRVVDGEPLPQPVRSSPSKAPETFGHWLPLLFIFLFFGGGVLRSMFGRLPGATLAGIGVSAVVWFLAGAAVMAVLAGIFVFIFTLAGGGGMGRGIGRGGALGGGFGGLGGGGFRGGGGFGGGGGGFGGGGASGRW